MAIEDRLGRIERSIERLVSALAQQRTRAAGEPSETTRQSEKRTPKTPGRPTIGSDRAHDPIPRVPAARPPATIHRPTRKEKCTTPSPDCCEQLLDLLQRLHKPKVSAKARLDCLCKTLPAKDAIAPVLFHTLQRYLAKDVPGNALETKMFAYFAEVPAEGMVALKKGLAGYNGLPDETRHCLFNERFTSWRRDRPIDPESVARAWLSEGLRFAIDEYKPLSGGGAGPGAQRPWEREFQVGDPDNPEYETVMAPWPWICSVSPDDTENISLRNMDHRPPVTDWQPHEIAQTCEPTDVAQDGKAVTYTCTPEVAAASEGELFASCPGGSPYKREDNVCLKILDTFPGHSVVLAGFNFFDPDLSVRLISQADPTITYNLGPVLVFGDQDESHQGLTDCTVHDTLSFTVPKLAPVGGGPFIPGYYEVRIILPTAKVQSPVLIGGVVQSELESNPVVVNVKPDPDLKYRIWNDFGRCYTETAGPGSDEIWFRAYSATFSPGASQTVPLITEHDMPRDPWDDMDAGEITGTYGAIDFFNGKLSEGGAVAIGLLGLEVDSEDAAKEAMNDSLEIFGQSMLKLFEIIGPILGAGGGVAEAALKAGASPGIIAAAFVAVVVVVIVIVIALAFISAWAPPDPVALDFMVHTASTLFFVTGAKTPVPSSTSYSLQDGEYGVDVYPGKAAPGVNAAFTQYSEERVYTQPAYPDEESRYGFIVRVEALGL